MPEERIPTITLTTDFGTKEHYVASMKGVILSIAPKVNVVDISHDIAPHDILEAGFVLRCAYEVFPMRTIHVVIVDPGVGTARRPIVVCTEKDYYVAPDNGVLSFIYDREPVSRVVELATEHYRRETVSSTFHGRDIFAPAAAWLARSIDPSNFGEEITDYRKIDVPKGKAAGPGVLQGIVIHVDHFGNLVTSIHQSEVEAMAATVPGKAPSRIRVGEREITSFRTNYGEGGSDEVFALFGSTGYLEIAASRRGAAAILQARRTQPVSLLFG